ncbi:unnamed protein product [Hermetia illucens]|uniref:Uncharacterized protein n=1 Tax=Hermetia illucens TaxID=343691 RepID=A0A7R8UYA2_HERIL|nr:golgin subfamily A member 4 [Hermetia illucens]CAD7089359.1 unnamed protein product [Hermetia illucens]
MSFSKAKLKRFNEIAVGDSPCSERKDHIKKFLKEVKDCYKDKEAAKETKEKDGKEPKVPATPSASDSESVKSSRSLRLFRTPSLPRRLRFKQHSESTPKKELQKDLAKGKEALEAANVEIKNKTEVLHDYQSQLDELKAEVFVLRENEARIKTESDLLIAEKEQVIKELSEELDRCKESLRKSQDQEERLSATIKQFESEIKMLLTSHESEVTFLTNTNTEVETAKERLKEENNKVLEENSVLKAELQGLGDELSVLKLAVQGSDGKIQEQSVQIEKLNAENFILLEEIEALKKQIQEDMLSFAQESQKMLKEIDDIKIEKEKLKEELENKQNLLNALKEELADKDVEMDLQRDSVREIFQQETQALTKKYEQQIATLKEINDMKIKEIESIHILEVAKMTRDHQEKMKSAERRRKEDLERNNDSIEEKIRLAGVQQEQRIKSLEASLEESIQKERVFWKSELDKCQKIAETEIIQGELEKQDLKTLLQSANEMLREKDDRIKELESRITNGIDYYISVNDQLEADINEVKEECNRLMTEKYNYQLTLNNTRSTVNILMERLKKSDTDVETLKNDLEAANRAKTDMELKNAALENEMKSLRKEMEEYKVALTALRNSSQAMEREMREKETIFEKLMSSEEETLEAVNKIGKLFNDRIEENLDKYFEMYTDLKRKYEEREIYIKDMKSLLDEFATGIELARLELDGKDKQILSLEQENKNIKVENMTYRYRCEQFEKYEEEKKREKEYERKVEQAERDFDDQADMISTKVIENLLSELDADVDIEQEKTFVISSSNSVDSNKIIEENQKLKAKLAEQIRRNDLLQEMIEMESDHAMENSDLKRKIEETDKARKNAEKLAREAAEKYNELKSKSLNIQNEKNFENLRETNTNLKNRILLLQATNKEHETIISDLQDKITFGTPRKASAKKQPTTPKTPKTPRTPKSLFPAFKGKENRSPMPMEIIQSPKNILTPRI